MAVQDEIISLAESIQRFKTEVISQDWSLSPKKILPLQAAVAGMKAHFSGRRNLIAMLNMAASVLEYARKRREPVAPEFVDFLKETMAHVVNVHEEETIDQEAEAELCKRVYGKFSRLREKVNAEKAPAPAPEPASPGRADAGPAASPAEKKATPEAKQGGRIMTEQRRNTRVPFRASAALDFPDRSHAACEIADLSLKGMFVYGADGHRPGETCRISLSLAGSTSHLTIKMKGTVVRAAEDGLALHFDAMDLDSFFHLKNVLYYNAENPDVLADEFNAQFKSHPNN